MDQQIPCSVLGYEKGNDYAFYNNASFKFGVIVLIILLIIAIVTLLFYKIIGKHTETKVLVSAYQPPLDPDWEFSRENLSLRKYLGEGAFGKVHMGVAKGIISKNDDTIVAVKMLKDDSLTSEKIAFMSEIDFMKKTGKHENVINLLGCCTQGGPWYAILEFASNGNIGNFLKSKNPQSSQMELLSYAEQVARGMEYLASKKYIHRDLAARNILVTEELVMKIADFGLSRDIRMKNYYRQKNSKGFPLMWMAPEAIFENKYTTKSDVWSYGVLLWEIFTHGRSVPNYIADHQLKEGMRLPQPPNCSNKIYNIMLKCWNYLSNKRPTFRDIVMDINPILSSSQEYLE